jgi:hypothetical protein
METVASMKTQPVAEKSEEAAATEQPSSTSIIGSRAIFLRSQGRGGGKLPARMAASCGDVGVGLHRHAGHSLVG